MRMRAPCSALMLLSGISLFLACGKPGVPKNVLLVTLDAVRADHLGCYGYRTDVTPHIDALAEESAAFTRAFTPVPMTLPSHASILTGTHPLHQERYLRTGNHLREVLFG